MPTERIDPIQRRWDTYFRGFVPERVTIAELQKLVPQHERRIRALAYKEGEKPTRPRANLAWILGTQFTAYAPWSSGPVALWANGDAEDLTGFFAVLWRRLPQEMYSFAALQLWQLIHALKFIVEDTVFDRVPAIEDVYSVMEDLPDGQYERFRAAMRPVVPETEEIVHRMRLEGRGFWAIDDNLRTLFQEAWDDWSKTRRLIAEDPLEFRSVIEVTGKPSIFSVKERENFFLRQIGSFFHEHISAAMNNRQ